MQNRNTTFGVKRNVLNIFHKIMLLAIIHSSFIAPSQNLIIGYLNFKEPLNYKGYVLNNEELKRQADNMALEKTSFSKGSNVPNNKVINNVLENVVLNTHYSISSDITLGLIGVSKEKPLDDSSDNLFKVYLKELPSLNSKVYLTYELFGAQDYTAVSRSINNRLSTGGYLIKNQMGWTTQKEEIDVKWLNLGENKIMFGIPLGASYQYKIKNLKIEVEEFKEGNINSNIVIPNLTINYIKNNQIYLKGFLRNFINNDVKVYIDDNLASFTDGEFEGFLTLTEALKKRKFLIVKAIDSRGLLGQEVIALDNLIEADKIFPLDKVEEKVSQFFKARKSNYLQTDGAKVTLKDSALVEDKEITIKKLRSIDIAPMGSGMINVTKGGLGYRFLPDGTKFEKPVMLSIAYDENLIPKGYTPNDIKTFYFNTDSKSWVAVKRDTINKEEKTVYSLTNHFTDYVNGIIQTPESPETAGFTPTMMNDIKASDPSSEMSLISPPEVSQKGEASFSYPIKIPAGRKGMQPQLAVQYSSEGDNSWLGRGWNIGAAAITIDTRWGVPKLDPDHETEIYTLNGEQLMYPKVNGQDWMPNRHQDIGGVYDTSPILRISNAVFTPRKQGSFAIIQRLGDNPSNYYWKVTSTDGTISWYGGKNGVVDNTVIKNSAGQIVYWGIYMTEDVFTNNIRYYYDNDTNFSGNGSPSQANLVGGQIFKLNNIKYTGYNNEDGLYEIQFIAKAPRPDISINARLGVKQVEPYLLTDIIVKKVDSTLPIRKYIFNYNPNLSKFKKSQLISVAELDKDDKEFYRHTFEYYDDLADGNGNDVYFSEGVDQTICFDDNTSICPDKDGDGVCDADDRCPNVFGVISNDGCPLCPDKDNDGVCDADDNCPDLAGTTNNQGCPLSCGQNLTVTDGQTGIYNYIVEVGTGIGSFGIDYDAFGIPDKFEVSWNNGTPSNGGAYNSSKFVGSYGNGSSNYYQMLLNLGIPASDINLVTSGSTATGTLLVNKTSAYPTTIKITVTAPLLQTFWSIKTVCPTTLGEKRDTAKVISGEAESKKCYTVSFPVPSDSSNNNEFSTKVKINGIPVNPNNKSYRFDSKLYNANEYYNLSDFISHIESTFGCKVSVDKNTITINAINSYMGFDSINLISTDGDSKTYSFTELDCNTLKVKPLNTAKKLLSVVNSNIKLSNTKNEIISKEITTKSKNDGKLNKGLFSEGNYFHNLLNNHSINYEPAGGNINPNCPPLYNYNFFINGLIPSFVSVGAILGSSSSTSFNAGGHLGFGIDFEWNNGHKLMTVGGGYSHSWESSESLTELIDIDGDGLEDCVYKFNNRLYWKKHLVSRSYDTNNEPIITHSFSSLKNITSIDGSIIDFYKSHGESSSYNIQLNAGTSGGSAIFGWDGSDNKSRSNVYFTDANGDGLMDIESYGTVYFNRIQGDIPFFEPESERTENMIIKAGPNEITPPEEVLEDVTPAYDVVKVWEAPANGTIKIDNVIENTDPTKEAIATIEMEKFEALKCYTISFPVPYTILKKFTFGASYHYDRITPVNISLFLKKLVVNGIDYSTPTKLYITNGDINGYRNDCLDYLNLTTTPWQTHGVIYSSDFLSRCNSFFNSIENDFPNSSFNLINYTANQNACSGCCYGDIVDNSLLQFELMSQSIDTLVYNSDWKHNDLPLNGTYCPPPNSNNSNGITEWLYNVPSTNILANGISTSIQVNGNVISNSSYTLANSSDFLSFKNDFENQYPNSLVTLNSQTNIITITINDTIDNFDTLTLTATNGSDSNSYNFSQIQCNQGLLKIDSDLLADKRNDWDSFRYTKDELKFIQKKNTSDGDWIYNQKVLLNENGQIKEKAIQDFSEEEKNEIIKERLKAQKEAQDWLIDYYKVLEEKKSSKIVARITNTATCTYTPSDLCLLYGLKLNASNSNVPITHNITTANTECNPEGGSLTVRKGDRIYFRVHSISTGNPSVNWDPRVSYTDSAMLATTDQNGQTPYSSSYSEGFILSQNIPVTFPGNGTAQITWDNITVNNPSDTVTYEIVKRQANSQTSSYPISYPETIIFSQVCQPGTTTIVSPTAALNAISANSTTSAVVSANSLAQFLFRVRSTSNVDWKLFEWKPKIICTTAQNITATLGGTSEGAVTDTETKYPIVDYSIYKPFNCGSYYKKTNINLYNSSGLSISPVITNSLFNNNDNGKLFFVVKRGNTLVGKRIINVVNGSATVMNADGLTLATTPIPIIGTGSEIEIGIYTDDSERPINHPTNVSLLFRLMNAPTIATIMNGATPISISASNVNFMHKPWSQFGPMYRQWGQFLYCPAKAENSIVNPTLGIKLIKEELLTITDAQATQLQTALNNNSIVNQSPINVQDPTATTNMYNDLNTLVNQSGINNFPFMIANPVRSINDNTIVEKWIGFHNENYASSTAFRAATLAQSYIFSGVVTTITQGLYDTGAIGIDRVTKGKGQNITAGGGIGSFQASAVSSLGGNSTTLTDYIDLNGDRYPDIVTPSRLQYTLKTGGLLSPINRSIGGAMSDDDNGNWGISASGTFSKAGKPIAADPAKRNGTDHIGKPGTFAFGSGGNSTGISGSFGSGDNYTTRMWADINGDGLPDIVKRSMSGMVANVSIDLNLGNNVFNAQNYWGNFTLAAGSSTTVGGGLGYNFANGSVEAGLSLGRTDSDTNNTLFDINGDGLLDKVSSNGSSISVDYNLGNNFASNVTQISNQFNYSNNAETVNSGINGTGTFAVIWPLYLLLVTIPLKIPDVSVTASLGSSTNRTKKTLTDFDGDGYPDFVQELSPGTVRVYSSRIRRTDLLKSVTNPLGGKFTIDYKVQPIDYDNPHAKWVMSDLVIEDGYDNTNDGRDVYKKHFIYEDARYDRREREFYGYETVKTQDYAMDADNLPTTVYRTFISKYHNRSYFLNGLLKESYVLKGDNESTKYSRTENIYELRELNFDNSEITSNVLPDNFDVGGREGRRTASVVMTKTINYLYELSPTPLLITEVDIYYDEKGRVKLFKNKGNIADASDDYSSKIEYHDNASLLAQNIINVPKGIYVSDALGLKRQRTTTVDTTNGNIDSMSALISSGVEAQTVMKYDGYGNLVYIQYPENHNGQHMFYDYTYDNVYHKYITAIKDAFGYSSSATYDSNFDEVTETKDMAGNLMKYDYDSFGRNTIILAPKEIEANEKYTIKFEYFPIYTNVENSSYKDCVEKNLFIPFSITSHYDVQHSGNDIQTVTLIDGLARPIQVKKDIQLNIGSPQEPIYKEAMSVSGKSWFDDFGRSIKQFHPYFEDKDCKLNYIVNEYDSPFYSKMVYEELDRPTQTTDPDGNTNIIEYTIATDVDGTLAIKTKTTVDQNGSQNIITETFKDALGKVISTKNEGATDLWTRFNYNAIGELLSYTDAESLVTSYNYDLLGRKTLVNHPDNGITTLEYDKANNLVQLQTANLANDASLNPADRYIKYNYDINRLETVIYPSTLSGDNISNVTYKYGNTGNETGRLVYQQDATGIQEFEYGNMGEVLHNRRVVVGPNIPTLTYETYFEYDSWNRLQVMKYPDGEKIAYKYDLGGNLFQMTGEVDAAPYDYIERIDYDYYEQRQYLLYGNQTETFYNYTPSLRRLNVLNVKLSNGQNLFNNQYDYDKVGNIVSLNNSANATSNGMGGNYSHTFKYDNLNRLQTAYGSFSGDQVSQQPLGNDYNSSYNLSMTYNNTHGIEQKEQQHTKNGVAVVSNTYQNHYEYLSGTHKVKVITDNNSSNQDIFNYDLNGNLIVKFDNIGNVRQMLWDESNRLRVVNENSSMQHYIYDASGERILKANTDTEAVYQNGTLVTNPVTINGYTTYPSAFIVTNQLGIYSKHYYAGSQRIVSRIGDGNAITVFGNSTPRISGNSTFDDNKLQKAQISDVKQLAEKVGRKNLIFKEFKPYTFEEIQKLFDEENKDDHQTPREVQRSPTLQPLYFYHPDNLGTSTALTDVNGDAYQFFLNLPFGETMAEQLPSSYYQTPYKFNGKELDEETGLYYYGARYYDPKVSIWYSVDPLAEMYPSWNPYNYTMQNPINLIDPTGMGPEGEGGDPPKKNIYIVIDYDGTYEEDCTRDTISFEGMNQEGWQGIYAKDFKDAYQQVSSYLGEYQADNMVLETHGGYSRAIENGPTTGTTVFSDNNNKSFISTKDLENSISGNNNKNQTDVDSLVGLINKVADGGNFFQSSCHTAQDDNFFLNLSQLSENKVNIFGTTSLCGPGEYTPNWATGNVVYNPKMLFNHNLTKSSQNSIKMYQAGCKGDPPISFNGIIMDRRGLVPF